VDAARTKLAAREQSGIEWSKKKSFLTRDMVEPEAETLGSPFVRFALDPAILGPVCDYLGVLPVLRYVDVWYSRHVPGPATKSQLWHCDNAEVSQVKVFVHCSDVEPTSGPLTVVNASTSRRLMRELDYEFKGPKSRVGDEVMDDKAPPAERARFTGQAGTAVFVDTSRCFHLGSRVSEEGPPRLVTIFQYVTPWAFSFEGDYRPHLPFRDLAADAATPAERLVLGG
jgi:hypothetical protein